jgi:hypothetical protein
MPTAIPLSLGIRPYAWIAIVVFIGVTLSLGLACAMPFAALAAVAALTLERRDALLLVGLAWLANQAVGFGVLHYPWTADTLAWGLALLAVPVLATLGAALCATRVGALPKSFVALVVFLSAFAIYEGLLFLVTLAVGAGMEAYEPEVVAKIFALNGAVFAAFLAASRLRLPRAWQQPGPARSAA